MHVGVPGSVFIEVARRFYNLDHTPPPTRMDDTTLNDPAHPERSAGTSTPVSHGPAEKEPFGDEPAPGEG